MILIALWDIEKPKSIKIFEENKNLATRTILKSVIVLRHKSYLSVYQIIYRFHFSLTPHIEKPIFCLSIFVHLPQLNISNPDCMKKITFVAIIIIGIVVALGASSFTANEKTPGNFKNLKILPQDISKDDLDSIMDGFTVALNVRCGFCHARKKDTTQRGLDFASDDKEEKSTAREMMKMVNTLNGSNFNFNNSTKPDTIHTIICYTCHRGMKQPTSANLMPEIKKIEEEREKAWKAQQGKK